jgi:hypothetical protein
MMVIFNGIRADRSSDGLFSRVLNAAAKFNLESKLVVQT